MKVHEGIFYIEVDKRMRNENVLIGYIPPCHGKNRLRIDTFVRCHRVKK
ncbi:MAG: hypothetical protein QXG11_03300 [Candidatus Bathyarchaeia archaeon]